jgi:hypothetical protein
MGDPTVPDKSNETASASLGTSTKGGGSQPERRCRPAAPRSRSRPAFGCEVEGLVSLSGVSLIGLRIRDLGGSGMGVGGWEMGVGGRGLRVGVRGFGILGSGFGVGG